MLLGELYVLCPLTLSPKRPPQHYYSRRPSAYVLPLMWQTKIHTHTKQQQKSGGFFVLSLNPPLHWIPRDLFSEREVKAAWSWPLAFIQSRDMESVELYHHSTKRILNVIFLSTRTNLSIRSSYRFKPFTLNIFRCDKYLMKTKNFIVDLTSYGYTWSSVQYYYFQRSETEHWVFSFLPILISLVKGTDIYIYIYIYIQWGPWWHSG